MPKGYLVDPTERTITQVDVVRPADLIGCSTITASAFNDAGDVVYVDDEGLLKGPTDFFLIEGYPQPLAGKGVVVGTDDEGDDVEPSVSLEWLQENIDCGCIVKMGNVIMFMGERHRKPIE